MAPSHYLNQCWLISNEVLWHSPDNFAGNAQDTSRWYESENYNFKITTASSRSHSVNPCHAGLVILHHYIFHFLPLLSTRDGAASWNPFPQKTRTCSSCRVYAKVVFIQILLNFVLKNPVDSESALAQIMAWCKWVTSHYLIQCVRHQALLETTLT